jgi:hypothetical protein
MDTSITDAESSPVSCEVVVGSVEGGGNTSGSSSPSPGFAAKSRALFKASLMDFFGLEDFGRDDLELVSSSSLLSSCRRACLADIYSKSLSGISILKKTKQNKMKRKRKTKKQINNTVSNDERYTKKKKRKKERKKERKVL